MAGARARKKKPLSPERIQDAALTLIEEIGLESFSMRSLASRLGVEAMSLYHYYPSKAHLLDALLDRLMATLDVPGPSVPWRERMRAIGVSYRALALRYPKFAPFMLVHRMNTREALALLEKMVMPFVDAGFDARQAAHGFRLFGYYLMGAILDEAAGYSRGPSAAEPVPVSEQRNIAPVMLGLGPYFAESEREAIFLRGLEIILDAFEALQRSNACRDLKRP
jgi:AcrR family transcriptional regulator